MTQKRSVWDFPKTVDVGARIEKLEARGPWLIASVRSRLSPWRRAWLLVRYRIRIKLIP